MTRSELALHEASAMGTDEGAPVSAIGGETGRSPRQDLAPLLNARSVAIVGISQLPRFGGWAYKNLRDFGYPGRIYGVNPRYTSLHGQPCYPSLSALPERPDCAILALPNRRLLSALEEAAALKIPAAVIFASAHSEPPAGQPALQDQLGEVARASDMVLCGPNCMGFLAFGQKLVVSGYPVTPGVPGGHVTFITHSGSVFDAVWQNKREVRFNYVISSGNETATTVADYMQFALADPTTRVVALFLETVRDPKTFVAALEEAVERDIPVLALKVGRSEPGAKLTQAHSGALAGQDAAYQALFAHYGVSRVTSLDEMMDALELFATGARPATPYVSSVHDSGGERGLLVDLAEAEGVRFAAINAETTARVAGVLEPGLEPVNPLDAWGTGNEFGRIFRDCLLALDADPMTGMNVLAVDMLSAGSVGSTYVEAALEIQPQLRKPLVCLANVASAAGDEQCSRLRRAGIPVLMGTETGVRALRHFLAYHQYQRARTAGEPEPAPPGLEPTRVTELLREVKQAADALDEHASKRILQAYGIAIPAEAIGSSWEEVRQAAERIGYPVALKTAAGERHKSDRGGVCLHLRDALSLSKAYHDLETRFGPRVLVQQMMPEGVEVILGLVNDAQFGPMLVLGTGGLYAEVFKDSRLLLLPVRRAEVRGALFSLRGAALFAGARGRPPADVEAVVDAALRLAALAADLGQAIAALDINPLVVGPTGAVAVDALIIPRTRPARGRWTPSAQIGKPLELHDCAVDPGWIDYNGHMTEASYLTAFGDASDALFRYVGIDEAYRAAGHSFYTVETHINYFQEVRRGEPLHITTQLLGLDEKRLHLFHAMHHGLSGDLLATTEQMLVHVDMEAKSASPIQPGVYSALSAVMAAHKEMPMPKAAGRQVSLKKH